MRSARQAEQSRQKVRKRRAALRPHAPEKRAQTPFFPDAFPLPTFIEGVADADDLPDRLVEAETRPSNFCANLREIEPRLRLLREA